MLNKFKNVVDLKQKTKLFSFMKNAHAEEPFAPLDYVGTAPFRDYEIKRAHAELEKAKALALQFIRIAI